MTVARSHLLDLGSAARWRIGGGRLTAGWRVDGVVRRRPGRKRWSHEHHTNPRTPTRPGSLALIANALSVSVTGLFQPAEEMNETDRLESLDRRVEEQQASRNRVLRSWRMLYIGVGIAVTILSFLLGGAGAAVIIAYWSGGLIAIIALQRIVLEPRLDEKYPLSRQLNRAQKKRGAPVLTEK